MVVFDHVLAGPKNLSPLAMGWLSGPGVEQTEVVGHRVILVCWLVLGMLHTTIENDLSGFWKTLDEIF